MATIKDIHQSISDMDADSLIQFISDMRNRRRFVPVKAVKTAAKKATTKRKHQPKQMDLFAQATNMTTAMKAELLAKLTAMSAE